jgi:hypothetical protein
MVDLRKLILALWKNNNNEIKSIKTVMLLNLVCKCDVITRFLCDFLIYVISQISLEM